MNTNIVDKLDEYNVFNGLIGMNRDINNKLTKYIKNDKDMIEVI
jgi:hypothetical protein